MLFSVGVNKTSFKKLEQIKTKHSCIICCILIRSLPVKGKLTLKECH